MPISVEMKMDRSVSMIQIILNTSISKSNHIEMKWNSAIFSFDEKKIIREKERERDRERKLILIYVYLYGYCSYYDRRDCFQEKTKKALSNIRRFHVEEKKSNELVERWNQQIDNNEKMN